MPPTLVTLFISGLNYPRAAAVFGAIAILGRIVYTLGYTTGDPKKRVRGVFEHFGRIPLLALSLYTIYRICATGI